MDDIFYEKTLQCPICSNEFKQTKVKNSQLRLLSTDTDMYRHYEGVNPYYYEINICPKCGFGFSDRFNADLSNADKSNFLKSVSMHWRKQDYCGKRDLNQAIETLKMAILCAQTIDLSSSIIAGVCLRLSWLYREMGNADEEKRFMKVAAENFQKFYELGGAFGEEDMKPEITVYLLGELNFRLGNNKEALKWFNVAISKYTRDPSVKKQTVDMIKDRWIEIKEQLKES